MRKLLALSLLLAVFASCSNRDKVVDYNKLPASAKEFISAHFPDERVAYVTVDREFMGKKYNVGFTDGTRLEFLGNGEWKEVDTHIMAVPQAIIPEPIREYILQNNPQAVITEIEREKSRYKIKLAGGLEIDFDKDYRVVEIDD